MECAICLQSLEEESAAALPCGHREFHAGCMLKAMLNGHFRCPLCREACVECEEGDYAAEVDEEQRAVRSALARARHEPALQGAASAYRRAIVAYHKAEREFAVHHRAARRLRDEMEAALRQLRKTVPRNVGRLVSSRFVVADFNDRGYDLWYAVDQARARLLHEAAAGEA